jgi:hypothetical protein
MADCLVVEASPQPPSNPCLTSCEQTAAPAETFQCHRLVLAAASPPLRAMLGGGAGAEMREAGQAEVVLHDTEPEVSKPVRGRHQESKQSKAGSCNCSHTLHSTR